ncbi:MAG TPA: DnaA/Hda family protein [Gemmatimonadales bacterium]|nr:DnaA/Hda family protein [Gemmatimonadales bacterium]
MSTELAPQFRFEELVVGASNRLAVTAARAVAEGPGTAYNPLFIYSRPGLGKTHLLNAVGHAAHEINPAVAVEYLTLDEFIDAFTGALAAGKGDQYRRRFLDVGLLLLDDAQFLAGRREMQAELLRVVDAMQTAGRQIVLASDRPPAEIEALDERLARRFGGGLVVDIGAPEYETRVAILRRRAEQRGAALGMPILEAIAEAAIDNVRELLGVLNRVVALQAVSDGPVSPAEVRRLAAQVAAAVPAPDHAPVEVPVAAGGVDEFTDFLQEVRATVTQQVEGWRAQVAEAMLRWEGEGYRVGRLAALLDRELPGDPAPELAAYEADVARLRGMQAEVAALMPDLAQSVALRDPDQLEAAEQVVARARAGAEPPPAPSPHWTLDGFLEAASNRVAVRAARAVAEEPGSRYNPLVVVGASGTGKTHLLHAIGNLLAARGLVPACASCHLFVDELIAAIDREAMPRWRARWRRADALLLDDIQLLAGKEQSQDELYLLFNECTERGRQMVFTSAVPLAELDGLEPRLRTRLEGGLVVELPAPEPELRQRAIERLLAAKLDAVDPELPGYIASRPAESMRAALGLVQRVLNAAEARSTPPGTMLARETLEGTPGRPATRRMTAPRSSGVVSGAAAAARNREKMIWEWPDIADCLIEEWR